MEERAAPSGLEQRVQPPGAFERIQVVTPSDMPLADPDLRHRRAPGLARHLGAQSRFAVDGDFFIGDALVVEQGFGPDTEGAPGGGR